MVRLAWLLLLAAVAAAGGGPETTLLVVNGEAPVSRLVANEYVRLRDIPPGHVVFLEGIPHFGVVGLDFFEERIWKPIREHIEAHGLEGRIELVTYSADFPYGVNFRPLLGEGKPPQGVGGIASLTGVTYLHRLVEAGEAFWDLGVNDYYRFRNPRPATPAERGHYMRAQRLQADQRHAEAAEAYALFFETYDDPIANALYDYACCLALLERDGEALELLGRAVEAGFSNADHARRDPDLARLREKPEFRALVGKMGKHAPGLQPTRAFRAADGYVLSTQLAYTGYKGNSVPEILRYLRAAAAADGTRPDGTVYVCRNGNIRSKAREGFFATLEARLGALGRKVEVLDGVLPQGRPDVFGAVIGAAGFDWAKSGSTILPGAICEHLTSHGANFGTRGQTKISELLRHGAAGSSGTVMEPLAIHQKFPNPLIHAFYAEGCSLAEAFYQGVAGPYQLMVVGDGLARPFAVFEDVPALEGPWSGTVRVEADELWVDGRPVPLVFDTTTIDDGHHDVRLVRIARGPIRTRSSRRLDVVVRNHGKPPKVAHRKGVVSTRSKGTLELLCHGRVVASSDDGQCPVPDGLGPGPVVLVPRVVAPDGTAFRAAPIPLDIDAPPRLRGKKAGRQGKPGLRAADGSVVPYLGDRLDGQPFRKQDAGPIELKGEFEAPADGFFQLVVRGRGKVTLDVSGRALCSGEELSGRQLCLPISLGEGWHRVRIVLEADGVSHLEILMGGDQVLAPLRLRH